MISSRTPEGDPNECPVCLQSLVIDPSRPPGEAPCPHCGHLLWFSEHDAWQQNEIHPSDERPREAWNRLLPGPVPGLVLLAAQLNVPVETLLAQVMANPRELEKLGVDSLDTVQLVMEYEEEVR